MQALSCLALLLITITVSCSGVTGITLSKVNERNNRLKTETWQEDVSQLISLIQLPPNELVMPYHQDTMHIERFPRKHKDHVTTSSSSTSTPPSSTQTPSTIPMDTTTHTSVTTNTGTTTPPSPPPKPKGEFGYYLNDGDLMLLGKNLSDLHRHDTVNSALFAQLASDYKYNRSVESQQWSKNYEVVLGQIGWALVSSAFHDIEVDDFFVISDVTLNLFTKGFSRIEKSVVRNLQHLLNQFDELDANFTTIAGKFYNVTSQSNSISFGATVCTEDADNSVHMFTIRVSFKVCEASKSYLFHLYDSECVGGKVRVEFSQYMLDEPIFSKARDTLKERLGPRMKYYVFKLTPK